MRRLKDFIPIFLFVLIIGAAIAVTSRDGWYGGYYKQNGELVKNAIVMIDGEDYLFNVQGKTESGFVELGGDTYYCDEGVILTGFIQDNNFTYYFAPQMLTGEQTIDGNIFFFFPNGHMGTGMIRIDGEDYYFAETGIRQTGWIEKHYFCPEKYTGVRDIEGTTYFFDDTGKLMEGLQTVEDETYLLIDGVAQTGWQFVDESTYYFADDGTMETGFVEIDGDEYYLDENGLVTDEWVDDKYIKSDGTVAKNEVIGKTYFDDDGDSVSFDGKEGSAGRLYIPAQDISVALNAIGLFDPNGQAVCDADDSAVYDKGQIQGVIAEHCHQNNFKNIQYAAGDHCYIVKGDSISEYVCTGVYSGKNLEYDLTLNGTSFLSHRFGDLVMYTCKGADWRNIWVAVWDEV